MPAISRFHGIVIPLWFRDHESPHVHARSAGRGDLLDVRRMTAIRGNLPRRQVRSVLRWAALHQHELLEDWDRSRANQPLLPIAPLP